MTPALNTTPLTAWHQAHGAKLVDFGGWQMPLQYSKVKLEHEATRKAVGLFDISHMGLLAITNGPQLTALQWLDGLVGQDLSKLVPGKAVYTHLLNDQGGIIDDIIIYALPVEKPSGSAFAGMTECLVICNASTTPKVRAWLEQHAKASQSGCELTWLNESLSLMALQGPQFEAVLKAAGWSGTLPKRFRCAAGQVGAIPVLMARTGYTGEDGVELIAPADQMVTLWQNLVQAAEPLGGLPAGLAARDSLRMEAAYPLYGAELDETITPLEAGLGWCVKFDKVPYIGKTALMAQQSAGLKRHLTCFSLAARSIPRHGDTIHDMNEQPLGILTSGCFSPTLDHPIAMGYIEGDTPLAVGQTVIIRIRDKACEATVVDRPFYQPS